MGLKHFEIQFPAGLSVIKSPNEAGKSSLLRALLQAFYGDAASKKQETLSQKSWKTNKDDSFLIEVELEAPHSSYVVTRNFGDRKNCLKLPNGQTLEDKRRIQEKLGELLGFPSLNGYLSTACIMQEEVRQVGRGSSELLSLIEERILQGARLQQIQNQLNKENKELSDI